MIRKMMKTVDLCSDQVLNMKDLSSMENTMAREDLPQKLESSMMDSL